jgi:NAD(P)H-hydrate epimerase
VVLTPHPVEASRLLGEGVDSLLADPIGAARKLSERFHAVAVFKTATPVVASPDGRVAIGIAGHSGMAVGGSGDALAGAVVARLAEGVEPFEATCQAVRAHARAGDIAGERGRRGMSVTDLVAALPQAWEEMEE